MMLSFPKIKIIGRKTELVKEHNELCFLNAILTFMSHSVEYILQTLNFRNVKLR